MRARSAVGVIEAAINTFSFEEALQRINTYLTNKGGRWPCAHGLQAEWTSAIDCRLCGTQLPHYAF